ncbi:hypothetical protein [Nocardioides iriomotensis]|uniref:DUF4267 domain-containing protein n=1 Tax=Nocardioides iriomotensis TaxID=715784 RepID=A0A4Q5ISS0_9ACTN|nr:hypothetical protein [Nocardioides iriomotensis]RYU08834.1 hypothetical protein ETU37_22495 [Nocardioides iriomotensis]
MSMTWSRLMSAATMVYGGYALAEPRHLGRFVTSNKPEQAGYDVLATTYGARDLAVGSIALLGRSERTVSAAMLARIAFDVSDGLILARRAEDDETRQQVLAVTFGWASLNALALLRDRRVARKRERASH